MPTKTPAWASKDGMLFTTAEQAAKRDLFVILTEKSGMNTESASAVCDVLMTHADIVVEALTTGPKSRPKARTEAGTTKPKRVNLGLVLDALRRSYALSDDDIRRKVADGTISSLRHIGPAKLELLQAWAKRITPEQAQAGFQAAREAVEALHRGEAA